MKERTIRPDKKEGKPQQTEYRKKLVAKYKTYQTDSKKMH